MYTRHKDCQNPYVNSNLSLLLGLRLGLDLLLGLARRLALQLVRATNSDVLGTEIAEKGLEDVLNDIATAVVKDHQHGERHLELVAEWHQAQLLVDLGDKLGGAGEGDGRGSNQTPVHGLVLANGLAEGTTLVVDREGGDLLDELEQVNSAVQEGRLELALEVNVLISPVAFVSNQQHTPGNSDVRFNLVDVSGQVDESHNVNGKLAKHGSNDVHVEDVWLRSFLGQPLDGLDIMSTCVHDSNWNDIPLRGR